MAPTTTPVTPAMTAEADTRERIRHVDGGTRGSAARRSSLSKAVSSTAARARATTVRVTVHPAERIASMPNTRASTPLTRVTAPGTSSLRSAPVCALPVATVRRVPTRTATPIGTLMKKTDRQPSALVMIPPNRTPAAMPRLPTVPHTARAACRCRPTYVVTMIDSAAGVRSAAPAPCAARARRSIDGPWARPLASDATVKTMRPARNAVRRLRRSAMRPPSRRRPPESST